PLPVPTVTAPAIMPLPPSQPPLTCTGPLPVREPPMLLTISLPRLIVVPPVYVFLWLRTSLPVPTLVSAPPESPEITPENFVLRLLLPTVRLLAPRNTVPLPSIEPIVTPGA